MSIREPRGNAPARKVWANAGRVTREQQRGPNRKSASSVAARIEGDGSAGPPLLPTAYPAAGRRARPGGCGAGEGLSWKPAAAPARRGVDRLRRLHRWMIARIFWFSVSCAFFEHLPREERSVGVLSRNCLTGVVGQRGRETRWPSLLVGRYPGNGAGRAAGGVVGQQALGLRPVGLVPERRRILLAQFAVVVLYLVASRRCIS